MVKISSIRESFPILNQKVNGFPLVYFDNAATTQKPRSVIEALQTYYTTDNANIHRAAHTIAARATEQFEETRRIAASFIGAREAEECIFTKGVTESINLVAQSWGRANLEIGDEVIISTMEHHSNIVPWQLICEERGAILKVLPITDAGELEMDTYANLLTAKTKMVSCVWVSNALGTINPIKEMVAMAHQFGALFMVDAAQAGSHLPIDVQDMDCDFMALSSHKLYGPTGVGVLYGKRHLLEAMPPYQGGGEMIREVSFTKTTYNDIPYKFEAGTPNIADVIAFKYALRFVEEIGKDWIASHENDLLNHFISGINELNRISDNSIQLIGTSENKISVQSFNLKNMHAFDAGMMLDAKGIAVRTGHHCTQPLMHRLGVEGTIRVSFAMYNTKEEVDFLLQSLRKLCRLPS